MPCVFEFRQLIKGSNTPPSFAYFADQNSALPWEDRWELYAG